MIPKCSDPKCSSTLFKSSVVEPIDSKFKIQVIHCVTCGCAIGVLEYYNIGAVLHKVAKALKIDL